MLAILTPAEAVRTESGQPARSITFSDDEQKAISSFGFLTLKPTLVVLNLADEQDGAELLARMHELTRQVPGTAVLGLPGKLEIRSMQSFKPSAPSPEYRMRETAGGLAR